MRQYAHVQRHPALLASFGTIILASTVTCLSGPGGGVDPSTEPTDPAPTEMPVATVDPTNAKTLPPNAAPQLTHSEELFALTQERISETLPELAKVRGLSITGEVGIRMIDKPGIRQFVKDAMYEQYSREESEISGRIAMSMGIFPTGIDFESTMLDLYEEGVLGIYDEKKKSMLIGDFVSKPMLTMVLGHEIAHALQDMHFDLEAMQAATKNNSESELARTFVVEGDAQATYLAWRSGERGVDAISDQLLLAMGDQALGITETVTDYPIFARLMQMPYTEGTATIINFVKQKGWAKVQSLYTNPPTTSEQMMHIDKLLKREPPLTVRINADLAAKVVPTHFESVWNDDIGEASLLAMLADVAPPRKAREAAAGWGGDQFAAYRSTTAPDAPLLLIGTIAWDTEKDAKQFEPIFREYLTAKKADNHILIRHKRNVFFATHVEQTGAQEALTKNAKRLFTVKSASSKNRKKRKSSKPSGTSGR